MNQVICVDSRYDGNYQIHNRIFKENVIVSDKGDKRGDPDDDVELFDTKF